MMRTPPTAPLLATMPIADAQSVTMTTKGSFHVEHEHDAHDRCGPKGVTRQLDYTVTVTGAPASLDAQGFLIDWQEVRRYFTEKFTTVGHFPSCEQIAIHAVRDIAAMLPGRCGGVTATIGFHGGAAELTAVWKAPDGWWQYAAEAERYSRAPESRETQRARALAHGHRVG